MGKSSNSIHVLLHGFSIAFLVLFFCCCLFHREHELTWSKRAALEAEAVASISCSGHGRAFLDGPVGDDGKPVCMCNSCYGGPLCSQFLPDCPVDVDSGDPVFSEPFWMKQAESSAVMLSGWHHMIYTMSGGSVISKELEKHIRLLHEAVGNANALENSCFLALDPPNCSM